MRGCVLGAAALALLVWAGPGQAGESAGPLGEQRARVLVRLDSLLKERGTHAAALVEEAKLVEAWRERDAAARAGGKPGPHVRELEPSPELAARLVTARSWLDQHDPLIAALQRKQADLFADAVALGEK